MLQVVHKYQVSILVNIDRVPGAAPAIYQGLRGFCRVLMVSAEHALTPDQEFPTIGYPDLRANHRSPDTFRPDFTLTMTGYKTGFGGGIVLSELDTDSMDQAEGIQTQYGASGNGKPDSAQSQSVLEGLEQDGTGNLVPSP